MTIEQEAEKLAADCFGVIIDAKVYDKMVQTLIPLLKAQRALDHLIETGVDNWEGYSLPPEEE